MVVSQKEFNCLMRIGIDARLWAEAGVGRYVRNLIYELQKKDTKNEYFIFLLKKDFDILEFNKNFTKIEANFKWYGVAEQIKFPNLLNKYKLDIVHFPHFNVPVLYKGKFIVTIHDLIHQHHQMKRATTLNPVIYKIKQAGYKKVFSSALSKSKKIITVSNFVKNQLIDEWGVDKDKIVLTYEAAEKSIIDISKKTTKEESKRCLEKFKVNPPFIFYVGNAHPHKNVERLIEAFLILRKKYQYLQLVLSGHDHYFWNRIKKENSHKDIIYTGYITDEELVSFYKSTQVFVMPSLEEGFGIPLLEAFGCSAPVVSSNGGSLPEIGGKACLYFEPKNVLEMVEQIEKVLNSASLRKELIEKGEKRVKEFSWEKLASETFLLYNS